MAESDAAGRRASRPRAARDLCDRRGPLRGRARRERRRIEAYAALHGYDVVLCTEFLAPERPPSWSRIPLIQALLDEYELVVWIDADAMLVEVGVDIADELPPGAELGLVEHRWYGGERRSANAGVMALRSTEWTRALLARLWAAERFVDHAWWENAALLEDLGYVVPEDLSPPYRRPGSELPPQLALLDAAWNSTADESASPHPRIRHLGRRESVQALRDELAGLLPQLRCSVMAAVAARDPGWTGRALSF